MNRSKSSSSIQVSSWLEPGSGPGNRPRMAEWAVGRAAPKSPGHGGQTVCPGQVLHGNARQCWLWGSLPGDLKFLVLS